MRSRRWRVKRLAVSPRGRVEWCAWLPGRPLSTAHWFPTWREAFAYADAMARAES